MYRIVAIAALGVVLSSGALAQIGLISGMGVGALVGSTVMAMTPVPVRASPPKGYLALPGKKVDVLTREDEYKIEDAKLLPYIFSTQAWVLLSNPASGEEIGWAYFGKDASTRGNFSVDR